MPFVARWTDSEGMSSLYPVASYLDLFAMLICLMDEVGRG